MTPGRGPRRRSIAARAQGCVEALFCLGDKPERRLLGVPPHARGLRPRAHGRLPATGRAATRSRTGLLPHTNAGVLEADEMARLKEVNVSLGLMLENVSPRLCEPGMPHHRAPDKRPERRMAMIEQAGALRIPFTTGILLGIGETRRERVESLLAIRAAHRRHGHIQEVIVQNFRAAPGHPHGAPRPSRRTSRLRTPWRWRASSSTTRWACRRPPNLNPGGTELLLSRRASTTWAASRP